MRAVCGRERENTFEWDHMSGLMQYSPSDLVVSLVLRWRMWQSQFSVLGKVFPIILPDSLTEVSLNVTLAELAEHMLGLSLQRVQEVSQYGDWQGRRWAKSQPPLG